MAKALAQPFFFIVCLCVFFNIFLAWMAISLFNRSEWQYVVCFFFFSYWSLEIPIPISQIRAHCRNHMFFSDLISEIDEALSAFRIIFKKRRFIGRTQEESCQQQLSTNVKRRPRIWRRVPVLLMRPSTHAS